MTKTRTALIALLGGAVAAGIVAILTYFSTDDVSVTRVVVFGVIMTAGFYLGQRRLIRKRQTPSNDLAGGRRPGRAR